MVSVPPVVGDASTLIDAFDYFRVAGKLGVAIIRSPTGWGKTSEVRQLYADLADRQGSDQFWPLRLDGEGRKSVYPSRVTPTSSAAMPYLWLGLRGELDAEGRPRFAGFDAAGQLQALVEPIAAALAEGDRLWRDRAWAVVKAVTSTTAMTLLPVGDVVQGLKELTDIAQELVELIPELIGLAAGRETRVQRALRTAGGSTLITDGSVQARNHAERGGRLLAAVSRAVPTVVAVEDAQLLDDHSVTMLRAWVRSELPAGMLILTEATDRPGPEVEWPRWRAELQAREHVYLMDLDRPGNEVLADLARDRIRRDHPGMRVAAELLADLVIAADGNPLTLDAFLDAPVVLRSLETADREGLDAVLEQPPTADTGLGMAFDRLTDTAKQTLCALAVHGDITVASWLDGALRLLGTVNPPDRAAAVRQAGDNGWCHRPYPDTIGFLDTAGYRINSAAAPRYIGPGERRKMLAQLAAFVAAARGGHGWQLIPAQVRQAAIQTLLDTANTVDADTRALLSIELDTLYTDTGQAQRRRDLLAYLTGFVTTEQNALPPATAQRLMITVTGSLIDVGETTAALRLLVAEHERLVTIVGADDAAALGAQHNVAAAQKAAGLLIEATATYEDVLRRRLAVHPPPRDAIRATRRDLAAVLTARGRAAEARDALQLLHDDNVEALGPDHPTTLTDDLLLYRAVRDAGNPDRAVRELTDLLDRMRRAFTRSDPIIRSATASLARATADTGDAIRASSLMSGVLTDELLLYGPEHPGTLSTRSSLASWRGKAGDPAGAAAAFADLLTDQLRILGPDHPDTLSTRSNLASWRGEAGDPAGAAAAFGDLLADRLRVLGPDHPDTLTTRNNLAYWRRAAGQAEDTS